MDLRETLSAQLPPFRQDEPARLRQDILDELNDHLVCAYNRELMRGVDRAVAERRVVEQFGDPAAVARRLWLDEMKGRIMAQRVLIATCLLVTAVSLTLVGFVWQRSIQAQMMVAEARAREQAMLKELHEISDAVRHPRSLDWNPVRMKLTEETTDGPPVAGATITLTRRFENPPKMIQKVSDASGLADLGSVQPGDYTFQIFKNSELCTLQTNGELNVQPGSDVTRSIVCPKPPVRVGVRVRCQWPADLEREAVCLYAPFRIRDRELGPGNQWTTSTTVKVPLGWLNQWQNGRFGQYRTLPPQHFILFGPSTRITEFLYGSVPFFWTLTRAAIQAKDAAKLGSREWAEFPEEDIRELEDPSATIEMETGHYRLSELLILRPSPAPDIQPGHRRYELILRTWHGKVEQMISELDGPPDINLVRQVNFVIKEPARSRLTPLELPEKYWLGLNDAFEARSGGPNEWTIPIPDELAQAVRKALKAPRAKPAEKPDAVKRSG